MLLAHARHRFDSISAEPYSTSSATSIYKVLLAGWQQSCYSKKGYPFNKDNIKVLNVEQINPSKTKTCLFTMQYTKSYGCAVLFLQDILLFDLTFLKFMSLWGKHKRNT